MKALAAYIMRGRLQAVTVTALSAALSLLLAPLSLISGAAVGLVTLRAGPRQGSMVMLLAAAAITALFVLSGRSVVAGAAFTLAAWTPTWVLATVLRLTIRLRVAVAAAAGIGGLVVVTIHSLVAEPAGWWRGQLEPFFAELARAQGQVEPPAAAFLDRVAEVMTGAAGAGVVMGTLASLLLARWWQALLYNPGGFAEEFQSLQLGPRAGAVTVALIMLAALGSGKVADLGGDLAMVAMTMHLLQGLALVHGIVARKRAHVGWLVAVYGLLVIAMPQMALVLAVAGLADTVFDFRAFFAEKDA